MKRVLVLTLMCLTSGGSVKPVFAQFGRLSSALRPSGQVSVYTNVSQTALEAGISRGFREMSTSATYSLPERDTDGVIYKIDIRHAHDIGASRPDRVSIYEAYAGARAADGRLMVRGGHLWLNELGALGSIAGGMVEVRSRPDPDSNISTIRAGGFAGREPNVFTYGYAANVKKYGAYVAMDGARARRQVVGFVSNKYGSLTERSVITAMNFLPIGQKFFLYQAAEYDVSAPGGKARGGLNYFLTNVRIAPTARLELQGNFSRGRSIDARGITEDSLTGRAVSPTALEGFLYESTGGRVTVEVAPRVRLNAGYARDKNNRDDAPTGRITFGGYAGNIAGSGFDVSASNSVVDRSTGAYHSRYVSLGRQLGRAVYVSGDFATSLAIVRFSRSDGVVVELRPHTTRMTGSATINVGRATSLLLNVDRTLDDGAREWRVLSGISYRLR
jgi:hypothetical protein